MLPADRCRCERWPATEGQLCHDAAAALLRHAPLADFAPADRADVERYRSAAMTPDGRQWLQKRIAGKLASGPPTVH